MTEPCKFEGEIAVFKNDIPEIKSLVKKIYTKLEGKDGLVTKVALLEQHIDEMPSPNQLKFWSAIGGGIVLFLGLLGYIIIKAL